MLLIYMTFVQIGAGNTVLFYGRKSNDMYSSIVNAYDILKVKNAVVKSV
jgi:hypothetical protein